jgi:hypothetical protein
MARWGRREGGREGGRKGGRDEKCLEFFKAKKA